MSPGPSAFWALLALGAVGLAGVALASDSWEETGGAEDTEPDLKVTNMQGTVRDRLGEFFTWEEVTRTSHDLPNDMPVDAKLRFQVLHDTVLDPLRRHLGRSVEISSGFRSDAVNRAVGGSSTSRHLTGEAADLKVSGLSPEAVAATILALGLPVDQVIDEGGWTHVGIALNRAMRRRYQRLAVVAGRKTYPDHTPNPALAV